MSAVDPDGPAERMSADIHGVPAPPSETQQSDTRASIELPRHTWRMTVAYDGTNYCGWQIQPNGVSLQSVVEEALTQFTREPIKAVASGRTDAGVHALGQVVSFSTTSTAPSHAFLHGLAQYLPDEIVVRDVQPAPEGFNARYDAQRKWYRYVIHNSVIRRPFLRNAVLWQRSRLDHDAMHAAVQYLVGTHDFRCFESNWPNRSSSVRTIMHASVSRAAGWDVWEDLAPTVPGEPRQASGPVASATPADVEPSFVCFDVQADGFLYNMVRAIVGTLIHVGRGRWTPEDMRRILETGDRTHAGETAPPQGLYLMRVDY
ncbi:tRNA pseudouridine(38-40) synthase TruA [Schlesneria paludicola]|uniref:tRNA pseudouridine(38-40) synthase TruA n=1 Tax=Schlesneria paludicola TaxID=360056 RepID=UPI00029ABAC7|nr:tRNA pseudouridine(38-40) synthase TruA [Schlesneria paludicola]